MRDDYTLSEIFNVAQKYASAGEDAFDSFKEEFFRYSPEWRVQVLSGYDYLMESQAQPSRETAMWIARKRELDDMHALLSRAGR
jgi:hypothetical protein